MTSNKQNNLIKQLKWLYQLVQGIQRGDAIVGVACRQIISDSHAYIHESVNTEAVIRLLIRAYQVRDNGVIM